MEPDRCLFTFRTSIDGDEDGIVPLIGAKRVPAGPRAIDPVAGFPRRNSRSASVLHKLYAVAVVLARMRSDRAGVGGALMAHGGSRLADDCGRMPAGAQWSVLTRKTHRRCLWL